MNNPPHSDPTVAYYNQHAGVFSGETQAVDMKHIYEAFLPLVPSGGKILDAGCGCGRDSRFFKHAGFCVTAFDASRELAAIASRNLAQPVSVATFLELDSVDEFDGIWACASLLHVPAAEMDTVLGRLVRASKKGAPFYVSFKYGTAECARHGRFFSDYDEAKLQRQLARHPDVSLMKMWTTSDSRPGRTQELWLNALLQKSSLQL